MQPDFQKLFVDYFGKTPRKVVYTVRRDSNRGHDLIFLNSLIHDARFRMSDAIVRAKCLILPVQRDCWELGLVKHADCCELYTTESAITISPVRSVKWPSVRGRRPKGLEFCINEGFCLGKSTDDETRALILDGQPGSCIITLLDDNITIRIEDRKIPSLDSAKKSTIEILPRKDGGRR
jgi:hypothetical protein